MHVCSVIGHRYRFCSVGERLEWTCERGCGTGGSKTYASPELAERYARAFDREDRHEIGRRAPLLGMFPLRIAYALRRRRRRAG